ncbi:MAG: accessory gene regulator ArgB-like protein, partial [Eubacterium sp.]
MTNKISSKIVEILIKHSLVENEDKELYSYGFFILLSQILYFIIVTTIGVLFNIILESIILYIAFQFIRRYAGGYHAKTETRCEILSTLSILCCIVLIKLSKMYDIRIALLSISLVFAVLIFILCPLDTPEKPLSDKEYKYFRKISWI